MSSGHVFTGKNASPYMSLKISALSRLISLRDRHLIVSRYSRSANIVVNEKFPGCYVMSFIDNAIRPIPIVLVKCWKVAHWNAKKLLKNCQKSKKLLPKFQKLLHKFLAIFI